jgi:murein DD-endopeptidase MepM/ murein hydrolase activator NlpD
MKVILTENQFKTILKEVDENSYPNLEKFFKLMTDPQSQIYKYLGAEVGEKFLQWLTAKNSDITNDNIQNNNEIIDPLNGKGKIITSEFGKRAVPTKGASTTHEGIDISVPSDTPVYAAAAGTVITAGVLKGYGGIVIIDHGGFKTKYAHLKNWNVYQGVKVEQGSKIGNSGGGSMDPNKGISTGPHLHFEIINNQDVAVNPLNYIKI